MYGEKLETAIKDLKTKLDNDILIIVGAEKVPPQYFELADWNVSVGNQPHSEVAALALFLDRITGGSWQKKQFNGDMKIAYPCGGNPTTSPTSLPTAACPGDSTAPTSRIPGAAAIICTMRPPMRPATPP